MKVERAENKQSAVESEFDNNSVFDGLTLSPSVASAYEILQKQEFVDAATFAGEILKNHFDYVDGRASVFLPLEETATKRPVKEWLDDLQSLFDPHLILKLSKKVSRPALHGRLAVVGLCLLEPRLRMQLEQNDFFAPLVSEIEIPFEEILTERGRSLLKVTYEEKQVGSEAFDSVPNQPDEPLRHTGDDQLGRAAFSRFLARRIQAVPADSGAYSMHIYGPWGSGKSTLLNFIRAELETSSEWVVTEFNAWRNQHIRPPWWSLMESIFSQNKDKLSWRQILAEYWWRFNTGRMHYILAFTILVWLLVIFVLPEFQRSENPSLKFLADTADSLSKVVALVLTLWGIGVGLSRSLLFGSAKAAKSYMELTADPMDSIKRRFTKLTKYVSPKRNAIFIDDLDRCQSAYVIELLEGIQTLFKDAPVVFVVAADRGWLNACYAQTYKDFEPIVHEPGKPLGMLFLEKAFQFSTPVPGIPEKLKESFWRDLVQVQNKELEKTQEAARKIAKGLMAKIDSEGGVIKLIDESRDKSFFEQRAIREEAVVRLAAPEVVERTEHALIPFAGLLDPNPRSMKRLVNSYSVNRAIVTLSHVDIERDRLVLWTILSLRWPKLAQRLEQESTLIDKIGQENVPGINGDLAELFTDERVIKVVKGGHTNTPLDANTVDQFSLLWF